MGELKPFVKEGWRKDLIAASGAARNSVFNKHLKKKKSTFLKVNRATHLTVEQSKCHV